MNGNCNIINEIELVILLVTVKFNIITVTSYCPTLIVEAMMIFYYYYLVNRKFKRTPFEI